MVEETIERIGLPVKCHVCKVRGFIKPRTNLSGWYRWKVLRGPSTWYCPEHGPAVKQSRKNFEANYPSPVEEISTEEQLYKLLD